MIGKLKLIGVALIILCMQAAALVYAQGGEQASSPGIAGQKPLHFIAMTVAGGGNVQNATDIPTEPQFVLEFDKNVVNSLIWGNNSKCFSLSSEDNDDIPVRVTKVDDTLDVTKKQNIYVQPLNSLSPGTAYYVKISPALKAKNGVTLGEGVSIAFRTKGETPVQPPQSVHERAKQDQPRTPAVSTEAMMPKEQRSKDPQKQQQVTTPTPAATDKSRRDLDPLPKDTIGNLAGWITPIGVFLIAGWIGFEMLLKRNKKQ